MANQNQGNGKNPNPQTTVATIPGQQIIFNSAILPVGAGQPVAVVKNVAGKTVAASGQIANTSVVLVNPA